MRSSSAERLQNVSDAYKWQPVGSSEPGNETLSLAAAPTGPTEMIEFWEKMVNLLLEAINFPESKPLKQNHKSFGPYCSRTSM